MSRTTEMKAAIGQRISPRFLLLAVLPALVLLAAMAPASALAGAGGGGGGGGTPGDCEATVTATQDPAVAAISVDCGDGNPISSVDLTTTEDGSVDGGTGTSCSEQDPRNFTCTPDGEDFLVTASFDGDSGDICASPRLTIDFTVELEDGSTEDIEDVVTQNCSETSGGGGGGGSEETLDEGGSIDEDDGTTPEGGIDSGWADTAKPSAPAGAAFPLTGAALVVLALATGGLLIRRARTTR